MFIPTTLSFVTVALISPDPTRFILGVLAGLLLGLGLTIGKTATRAEIQKIAVGLTAIAVFGAAIAFVETLNQAPLYEFTAFQSSTNVRVAFRASAFFGHPLVQFSCWPWL